MYIEDRRHRVVVVANHDVAVAPLVNPEQAEHARQTPERLKRGPKDLVIVRRREDLDVVLFDQLSQKLPEVRHDRIMQAVVDLIDQQDPVPRRSQFHRDGKEADKTLSANSKWHERFQTYVEVDRWTGDFREDFDSLRSRLDDRESLEDIKFAFDLTERAECLSITNLVGIISSAEKGRPHHVGSSCAAKSFTREKLTKDCGF